MPAPAVAQPVPDVQAQIQAQAQAQVQPQPLQAPVRTPAFHHELAALEQGYLEQIRRLRGEILELKGALRSDSHAIIDVCLSSYSF